MVVLDAAQLANVSASALIAIAAAVVVVVYHVKARWWESKWGWNLMGFTVSVGLLGLYTVLITLVWPSGPAAAVLRVSRCVLLVVMAGLMVQRVRLVVDAQRREPPDGP